MVKLRIGDVLVQNNVLTPQQVEEALEAQQRSGGPFGLICERMYGIDPHDVERAWSQQYASVATPFDPDLEPIDPACLELITRRQAWQFCVMAVRFDGVELALATSELHLPRALRFAHYVLDMPSHLLMTDPHKLGCALVRHYPMKGMTAEYVQQPRPKFKNCGPCVNAA